MQSKLNLFQPVKLHVQNSYHCADLVVDWKVSDAVGQAVQFMSNRQKHVDIYVSDVVRALHHQVRPVLRLNITLFFPALRERSTGGGRLYQYSSYMHYSRR